jgi:hypothetical protein
VLKHEKEITSLTEEVCMLKSLLQSISLQLVNTKEQEISNKASPNTDDHKYDKEKQKVSTSEPSFKCEMCIFKCEKIITMNKHKNTKHESCVNGNKDNKSVQDTKKHDDSDKEKVSKGKWYCDECNFSSSNKKTLKKHKDKGHERKECDYCKETFMRESEMNDHINERHAKIDDPSKCGFKKCSEDEVCDGCLSDWQLTENDKK